MCLSLRDAELDVESLESRWGQPWPRDSVLVATDSVSRRPYASGSMAEASVSSIIVVGGSRWLSTGLGVCLLGFLHVCV